MDDVEGRLLPVANDFSLAQTCGPVAWARGRSPRHDWIDGALIIVESRDGRVTWRRVTQPEPECLHITSNGTGEPDEAWARRVLRVDAGLPTFADPVVAALAARFP